MKISLSIADLPLNTSIEALFELSNELGIDGVEILPGIKTFFSIRKLTELSQKYNMPILSVHYPFWVGKAIISSRKAFATAQHFHALLVVHPLKNYPLSSAPQKKFMRKIKQLSNEYNVPVTIENMSPQSTLPIYKYFSHTHQSTTKLSEIYRLCKRHGFGITLDTSHLKAADITSLKNFALIRPIIKNVHLSDYNTTKQHLGLGQGKLDSNKLIRNLIKNNYKGLITLELSPRIFCFRAKYYSDIQQSFNLVKEYLSADQDASVRLRK